MLDWVDGRGAQLTDDGLSVNCGPVGLTLACAARDVERVLGGKPERVPVLLEVETMTLVGFADTERRELYRAVRKCPGVGSKTALLVLDCGEALDTLRAVSAKEVDYFRGIPGLGPARIGAVLKTLGKHYGKSLPVVLPCEVSVWVEAREQLQNRGLTADEAERVLAETMADTQRD